MIRALALRNLRHHARLLASLVVGVFALEIVIVQIASSFAGDPAFIQLYNSFPAFLRNFIGMDIEELSFGVFVSFGFQHPATLAMGLCLVVLMATVPAAERENGFLDLVLARPVRRAQYLTAIVVAVGVGAVLLPAAGLVGAALGLGFIEVEEELSWMRYFSNAFGLMTLLLAFGGVALCLASGAKRRGSASARAVGVILVMFVLEAFANLYDPLERVRWLSLFHYFRPISFAAPSATDPLVLLAVFGATTSVAFVRFARRDV